MAVSEAGVMVIEGPAVTVIFMLTKAVAPPLSETRTATRYTPAEPTGGVPLIKPPALTASQDGAGPWTSHA